MKNTSTAGTTRACRRWSARRRGFTRRGFRLFAERIGVSKSDSWIDAERARGLLPRPAQRIAERRVAVLDPLKLVITNYPEGQAEAFAPNHPLKPELGKRSMPFSREAVDRAEDFMEEPPEGFHRLYPATWHACATATS